MNIDLKNIIIVNENKVNYTINTFTDNVVYITQIKKPTNIQECRQIDISQLRNKKISIVYTTV